MEIIEEPKGVASEKIQHASIHREKSLLMARDISSPVNISSGIAKKG